jgi:TolB-like protein/class 3 adenylate cyclase/Flp pilus assembly protein TadD
LNQTQGHRQRLSAILAADGVGFSRLMALDEETTVRSLDAGREAFRTAILAEGGRVVDMAGDSVLAVFETAAGAVAAAVQSQQSVEALAMKESSERRLRFRIGLHLGDVIAKPDGSIYGDGVNIAARLQALAPAGGIVISDAVRSSVRSRMPLLQDLGEQIVKNIPDPVRAFRVCLPNDQPAYKEPSSDRGRPSARHIFWTLAAIAIAAGVAININRIHSFESNFASGRLVLDKSIAVLPFVNLSGDKDQEFFSDGLADELIDLLAKTPALKVIARSSSFAFKGKTEDIQLISRKLNVSNILEGSVRRSGTRLRVTIALVQASTGQNIWSDTYDREMRDIFDLQDDIARAVVGSLRAQFLPASKPTAIYQTSNPDAYVQYLLGREYRNHSNIAGFRLAAAAYQRAITLDPNYAAAYAGLSITEYQVADLNNDAAGFRRSKEAADRAVALAPENGAGYFARGFLRHRREWLWAGALADFEKALSIDPGNGEVRREYGLLLYNLGRIRDAIAEVNRAVDLDPLSGDSWAYLQRMHYANGDRTAADNAARRAIELQPNSSRALVAYGSSQLLEGNASEALNAFQKIDDPGLRLTNEAMAEHTLGRESDSINHLRTAVDKAGDDSAYQIAQAHAWRGEKEAAFTWLDRAYQNRDGGLLLIKNDALLVSLRQDLRFQKLLLRLNLP